MAPRFIASGALLLAWVMTAGLAQSQASPPSPPPPSPPPPSPAPGAPAPQPQQPPYYQSAPPPQAAPYGNAPPPYPYGDPAYAQPYPPPYIPPPPQRSELHASIRFNPLDLVFGRLNFQFEAAIGGPVSILVAPVYIFADPRQSPHDGIRGKGWGFYSELAFWIEGRPLRGYFLKAHAGYDSVTFRSDVGDAELKVPQTSFGALFGSQSIYAGWFTISTGLGVAYDTQAEERTLHIPATSSSPPIDYIIAKSGLLQNGVDIIPEFSLGGSF